jgi:polysaccharide pyruvyl transferase WcaK-like protein
MRIALWNASCLDNLGDRLLDRVNRIELEKRIPGATVQTFGLWPSASLPLVRIDGSGAWNGEGSFDAIVIGGGALLIGPPFVHPSLQTCYLGPYPERFRDRCPVIWNAVCSDGQFVPALAEPWRAYVRAAARRLTWRSVRNQRTADLLIECGVTDEIPVVPDPVLLLSSVTHRQRRRSDRLRIGLALGASGDSADFAAYLGSPDPDSDRNSAVCVHAVDKLLAANPAHRRLDQFATRIAETLDGMRNRCDLEVVAFGTVYGDEQTGAELVRALKCGRVLLHDSQGSDALAWIASLDCLLASRLHACILAVVAGTPLVALDPYFSPVAGTSKVREFMHSAGLSAEYAPLYQFLAGDGRIDDMVERAIREQDRLPAIRETLRRAASSHFDTVAAIVRRGRMDGHTASARVA